MNALANTPELRGELRHEEALAAHTSWRVGGPARLWYRPADVDDLCVFLAGLDDTVPVLWLGLGSNLLVRDGGFPGAVIATHRVLDTLTRLADGRVRVGAGVPCAKLAKQCVRWQLGPAYFFAGIPGTVGGALAMNAGAFGGETWSNVSRVEVVDRAGQRRWRSKEDYAIAYRDVRRQVGSSVQEWFLHADLDLVIDPTTNAAGIRELLARRKASQPVGLPSCGSVFRNPPDDYAARLIEAVGLKGQSIGGAQVSPKHANFIINTGAATAADIEQLITRVQTEVQAVSGIELKREVLIVGEPA